ISGNVKLSSDKISGEFIPDNVSFIDLNSYKIRLNSGKIRLKDEKTYFDSFAFDYDKMPVYFDGFIETNDSIEPDFNIYFSTNLNEENCDKLINPNLKYPILITGETQLKGRFLGKPDSYTSYLTLSFDKGSDFSFMGLKLGDIDVKREIASKINFKGQNADINYVRYFKYLPSKNKKQTPHDLIKISGNINLKNGEILCSNLHLLTPNPAPVRFLNPVFKKSLMKDGQFVSDLVLNGSFADIKAEGNLEFSNVLVPMYDSIIDDIKINLTKNTGKANFSLTFFDTKADITFDFVNKMSLPFIINDISIHSSEVPINSLMNAFTLFADSASKIDSVVSPVEQNAFITPSDIQIKSGSITADKILFNEVEGQNLKLKFSHSKDTSLKIDDAYLAIAGGLIRGNGTYKFDTKDVYVSSDFLNCDANELTKAFFNLQGQIHGNSNGKFTISMHDFTPKDYVNKIKADAEFEILNGTMPKLGSIEYLLRASNFFKSGIFGLTINNVIELLTPYKHGDFNKITGTFKIDEANLKDLKIYSQGDNLSTYTYGSYDIVNGIANIEILGKLSKNISNLLGAIGNASVVSVLNTLTRNKMDELVKTEAMQNVSKIPLMDLNNDDFRLFSVKLTGPISTDDVVKSFNWLN
ncbi:MAG: hypothetical protein LUE64_05600, partial [Candidatus Gastranaerophilales bacterium]|nr:hypothetical protein [Candidatus Gastranaerophilales bacterium]